ncbi:Glucose-1-phosphate thymidylyltransferase [Prochlorococcus marinus str. MIT 9302]|uniref:Glucose-1-phosphate thymidylyltransferase n=1 Tax=Prochlorococcus marinus str. MIT 9302 TaxID=74545 RepID=A0A0A2A7S2_PROMR|nr:glucose-1-phosphate thymidylyltransferase RfbA [Prochlorococcus marinus]KGF96896.1 Glucose-1-phosphate thymidylyltransferase [Prochlorococcus marinus str. MIT 9302]
MEDNCRKGIILAGGKGTRLSPVTFGVSKQLLPLYNKPAIYYPLSTLMLSGIRNFLIIVNPKDLNNFKSLLGNGEQFGIEISYAEQSSPDGIAQAFTIGEKFIGDSNVALILGDNFFYGNSLSKDLLKASKKNKGATIFACEVKDPERYGVVDFDKDLKVKSIIEKPKNPLTNFAVTGLYFYDNNVIEYSKKLKPSKRGELEITDLNMIYLKKGELEVNLFARAIIWLDTGTFDSLYEAGALVKSIENKQIFKIGCPEEISWRMGWINSDQLNSLLIKYKNNEYGNYLKNLIQSKNMF